MKKNMNAADRITRALIAFVLLFLNYVELTTGITGVIFYILAGIFLFTAITGFCPLYVPLHISTNKN